MAQYGALKATNHLSELTEPLVGDETGVGVVSAATRQAAAVSNLGITATAAELNALADASAITGLLTAGSGITTAAADYQNTVVRSGPFIYTRIYFDIEGLNEGGTAGDVIGDDGAANNHFGQLTAAVNGTIIGGTMHCVEVPAGGTVDIDLYSADEATLAEDSAISAATGEVQLINSGGWSAGEIQGLTSLPVADQYLYLVGQGTGNTAYTAGRFYIELIGLAA